MRILYVGKHNQRSGNDDEGALVHVMNITNHICEAIHENYIPSNPSNPVPKEDWDLILYNHPSLASRMLNVKTKVPKVFWCFDLIEYPEDESLSKRNERRRSWALGMGRVCDYGFFTDGDWVESRAHKNIRCLRQGADPRVAHKFKPSLHEQDKLPILFTGDIKHSGTLRAKAVQRLIDRYEKNFAIVRNNHGRVLGQLIADSKIVIAPLHPTTDKYWSNRVYNSLGFGAFMLHPYCKELAEEYEDGVHLVFYKTVEELEDKIDYYLPRPEEREEIAKAGFIKTIENYTYTHRFEKLLNSIVKELI